MKVLVLLALVARIGHSNAFSLHQPHTLQSRPTNTFNERQFGRQDTTVTTPLHMSASILAGTIETIQAFSKSSISSGSAKQILEQVTQQALTTPPVAYFLALMASGCGIPVSEDALCIFAGAAWPTLPGERQIRMFIALYLGVVVSDFLSFWIGRGMRLGVLSPLAKKLELGEQEVVETEQADGRTTSKRQKVKRILKKSGDWVGFVTRFSVGLRGPLMLLTGFSNQVPFIKFAVGTSAGAIFTLPLQLYAGYALGGRNPAAVVAVVTGISSFVMATAAIAAALSSGTLLMAQFQIMRSRSARQAS
jgi:membrane protein DedA with SNARE-associated domain